MPMEFVRDRLLDIVQIPFYSWIERKRWRQHFKRRRAMPRFVTLKPLGSARRWTLLFLYIPGGMLDAVQCDILHRVRRLHRRLLVVCASPARRDVPDEVLATADAVIWKDLPGFDFSAYAIGLHAIATHSPNAEVFVLNDSVYGPLQDVEALVDRHSWDLTGFISSREVETHLQSFAFLMRGVDARGMRRLKRIFPMTYCYDDYASTVLCLETSFARVAARHMSVGSLWSLPPDERRNPSLFFATELLDDGFPFLKRRLLDEPQSHLDQLELRARLAAMGVPEPPPAGEHRSTPSLVWA